jgi:hypothetical protein
MKNILLLISVLVCTNLLSQKNRAGISFSPDITNRTLNSVSSYVPITEIPKWGFTTGFNYERQLHKRVWLTTGIFLTDKGWQSTQIDLRYSAPEPLPYANAFSYKYSFYQLVVPVAASYYFHLKKTRLFVNAGININYLLQVRHIHTFYYTDNTENRRINFRYKSNYNNLNAGAELALGIERDFRSFTFRFSPRSRWAITNQYKNSFTNQKVYLNSFDLNFSVLKSF